MIGTPYGLHGILSSPCLRYKITYHTSQTPEPRDTSKQILLPSLPTRATSKIPIGLRNRIAEHASCRARRLVSTGYIASVQPVISCTLSPELPYSAAHARCGCDPSRVYALASNPQTLTRSNNTYFDRYSVDHADKPSTSLVVLCGEALTPRGRITVLQSM